MRSLIVISFLASFGAHAQNWALLNPAYKYNYSNDGSDTISNQIFVTHIDTLGVDSFRYELNRIGVVCDTCPASLGGPCDGCFAWLNQPQALQRSVIVSDGEWLFVDPDTFLILTDAPLDSLWSFHPDGSVLASLGPAVASEVFGVPDSARTIALSNGDSLLLSRTFGLLHVSGLVSVGVEGAEVGVLFPKALDFFDFQVGDVVSYYMWETFGSQFPPEVDWQQYRHMIITSRTELPNGRTYGYILDIDISTGSGMQLPWWMDPGMTGTWTITEPILWGQHRMIFSYPGEVLSPRCFGTSDADGTGGRYIAEWKIGADGRWSVGNRMIDAQQTQCGPEDSPLIMDSEILPGLYAMADYACASCSYVEGTGVRRADIGPPHTCTLSGWLSPVGLSSHAPTMGLRLFPVPATDALFLEEDFIAPLTYQIVSITGQSLSSGRLTSKSRQVIDVSALPVGMYLLRTTTRQGTRSQRFIIAR